MKINIGHLLLNRAYLSPQLEALACQGKRFTYEQVNTRVNQFAAFLLERQGPQVFSGYWNNPEATSKAIQDGWLHTGDLGKIDEQGFVYVIDRLKDMIISGGENIYSAELEAVIGSLPEVAEVAVILWGVFCQCEFAVYL